MTNRFRQLTAVLMLILLWLSAAGGSSRAEDPGQDVKLSPRTSSQTPRPSDGGEDSDRDDELNLADLTAYRAALSGKATADDARSSDPSARVGFRELWQRSDAHRGRRVTVEGRVARIFRQGPVGSFPPLIQVWAYSPAGDPFCLVFPRPTGPTTPGPDPEPRAASPQVNRPAEDAHPTPTAIPVLGQTVQFTGTFLKMVRYAAGDGPRLAPLIVGDGPPAPAARAQGNRLSPMPTPPVPLPPRPRSSAPSGARAPGCGPDRWAWSPTSWGLGLTLAAVAAGILAWQHLRGAQLRVRSARRNRLLDPGSADPSPGFHGHDAGISRIEYR